MTASPENLAQADLVRLLEALPCPVLVEFEGDPIVWSNQALEYALRLEAGSLKGQRLADVPIVGLDPRPRQAVIYRALDGTIECGFRARVSELPAADGQLRITAFELVDGRPPVVVPLGGAGIKSALGRRAVGGVDPATGLSNRASLGHVLDSEVSRSRRYDNPLTIVLVRVATDALPGDAYRVMVDVGCALQEHTRWADNVGRWDASEFLVVLPETDGSAARALVRKLRSRLDETPYGRVIEFGQAEWRRGDDANLLIGRAQSGFLRDVSVLAAK